MGLWNFMTKMVQGKPVFEAPPRTQEDQQVGSEGQPAGGMVNPSPFVDQGGKKILPHIRIEHCKSHLNGDHMEVTAWLTNESEFEVELDRITLLDARTVIGRRLRPHEGHEATLYRGPQPTSDHNHKASLTYKIVQNGDYFSADFMVEYNRESNGAFTVEEFHSEHIIHDV